MAYATRTLIETLKYTTLNTVQKSPVIASFWFTTLASTKQVKTFPGQFQPIWDIVAYYDAPRQSSFKKRRRTYYTTQAICTYVPTYLPIPNFCYSTTGHDHDRPGALRPMPASPTQPHTYKLPAASVDYIPTCSRPLIEFPTVSKKKAVRNH